MLEDYEAYFSRAMANMPPELAALGERIPIGWRADAQFFLATSIFNMVVGPYQFVTRGAPPPGATRLLLEESPLWEPLLEDLRRIVGLSEGIAEARGRSYVSATSVAQALGILAPTLRTTSIEIWGDEEEAATSSQPGGSLT